MLHRLDDGAVARPAAGCAAAVDSLAPDVAAASEGCAAPLLGLPPSSWHQRAVASARHSTISTSSRAFSDGLASVARLLYALVALGLAYIRCVENADDLTRHARVSPRWTRRHPGQITLARGQYGPRRFTTTTGAQQHQQLGAPELLHRAERVSVIL